MSDKPTGNPVFDFKAGFRAKAATLQSVLFYGGVTAEASDGFNDTHLFLLVGLVLIVISVIWGYAWRSKLRDDFRRECQ